MKGEAGLGKMVEGQVCKGLKRIMDHNESFSFCFPTILTRSFFAFQVCHASGIRLFRTEKPLGYKIMLRVHIPREGFRRNPGTAAMARAAPLEG